MNSDARLVDQKSDERINMAGTAFGLYEDEETKRKNIEEYRKRAVKGLPLFGDRKKSVTRRRKRYGQKNPKGYYWKGYRKEYKAQIQVNGKVITLGYFKIAAKARSAYLKAKKKYHK